MSAAAAPLLTCSVWFDGADASGKAPRERDARTRGAGEHHSSFHRRVFVLNGSNLTNCTDASETPRARAHHVTDPLIEVDLAAELESLRPSASYQAADHAAKTIVKQPGIRVVRIALKAGGHMHEHHADCAITVQGVDGHVEFSTRPRRDVGVKSTWRRRGTRGVTPPPSPRRARGGRGFPAALRNASDHDRLSQKGGHEVGGPCGADPPAALPRAASHDRRGTNRKMINDPLDAGSC